MCIKQRFATSGTHTTGGTRSYLAIIIFFHNAIRNTEEHDLSDAGYPDQLGLLG